MKRVNVDKQNECIREFIHSLPVDKEGCILVVDGKPLLQVVPVTKVSADQVKLKKAILARRDESRRLNQEWEEVDQEGWANLDRAQEGR